MIYGVRMDRQELPTGLVGTRGHATEAVEDPRRSFSTVHSNGWNASNARDNL